MGTKYRRKDLAQLLGLTEDEVRVRVEPLEEQLGDHVTGNGRGKTKLYDDYFFTAFKQVSTKVKNGVSISQAVQTVIQELANPDKVSESEPQIEPKYSNELIEQLKGRIRDLQAEVKYLREQNQRLLTGDTLDNPGIIRRVWGKLW